ncbi:hypothetical protein FQK07_14150 [Synechococcus sp. BSF8S]|uniref:DEAD/DEAH box helicase family protein n=1 Tax=Synechococcales TaxID=1890424 RepID=UPI0016260FD5|nr:MULTISPECIES: DEAD/DEAH box helicase family protein [unclassified Synechococcus]MBC1262372.1 hypothetical protein [Synechococcus sp. BSF8S]MBC1265293.1 hypothetical protein [Synechococcus sp. BSA11S]
MVSTAPPGPIQQQVLQPNALQQLMLDVPLDHILVAATAKATGKTFGIVLLVIRDAKILKDEYHCLITRSTFQALQELQTLLYKYLTLAYPGTTWNAGENTFRIGGKSALYGTCELAYSASSPLEQIRAQNRLQGRSKCVAIHDEVGVMPSPDFYDTLAGIIRAKPGVQTRQVFLANPGGPGHVWLKERFALPAGLPGPMQPKRFWSDTYEKWVVFVTANASINPHIDWEAYKRNVELMAGGDPAMLAALLEGRWDLDLGGSFFASCWSPARCRVDIRPGQINLKTHSPRAFVCGDFGYSAPSVFYLVIPDPPFIDYPKGSLLLADELYLAAPGAGGRRDWRKGPCLSSAEQAGVLRQWLQRWGVEPEDLKVLADDAVFNRTGSEKGSTAEDFRAGGVRLLPAEKARTPVNVGLSMLRNRLKATGVDHERPWLMWSVACEGFEATMPSLPTHPRDVEVIADGTGIDHAVDAVRYAVAWYGSRYTSGPTNYRVW